MHDIKTLLYEYDVKFTLKKFIHGTEDFQLEKMFVIFDKCLWSIKNFKDHSLSLIEDEMLYRSGKNDLLNFKLINESYIDIFNLQIEAVNIIIDLYEETEEYDDLNIDEQIAFFFQNVDIILKTLYKSNKRIKEILDV